MLINNRIKSILILVFIFIISISGCSQVNESPGANSINSEQGRIENKNCQEKTIAGVKKDFILSIVPELEFYNPETSPLPGIPLIAHIEGTGIPEHFYLHWSTNQGSFMLLDHKSQVTELGSDACMEYIGKIYWSPLGNQDSCDGLQNPVLEIMVKLENSSRDSILAQSVLAVTRTEQGFFTINPSQYVLHYGEYCSKKQNEFSIKVGDSIIALNDWEDEIDLKGILGNPINEETVELGQEADTFSGSLVKVLYYEGLMIKLFSPSHNKEEFWVMEIVVSNKNYGTFSGIRIGDNLQELKEIYPGLTIAENGSADENNCAYELADRENYNYMFFEVCNGIVSQIRIMHEMP